MPTAKCHLGFPFQCSIDPAYILSDLDITNLDCQCYSAESLAINTNIIQHVGKLVGVVRQVLLVLDRPR